MFDDWESPNLWAAFLLGGVGVVTCGACVLGAGVVGLIAWIAS